MDVVFVPVRHHSPACARLVAGLVAARRPSHVLIEGPSDFERMDELALPHRLPIAIYSFVRSETQRSGAYYPFCVYSPEWQAIRAAADAGVPCAFIDLPWTAKVGADEHAGIEYADGALRRARLVSALCDAIGVETFDALWDTLFEIPTEAEPDVLLARLDAFCTALRAADEEVGAVSSYDLVREAFMRARIAQVVAASAHDAGPILVVTGGYHTAALRAFEGAAEPAVEHVVGESGIALTPYSFERLDAHTGYAAGVPSPGFYQAIWDGVSPLAIAATALRARKQHVSTADLITAESLAHGLAAMRGHERVFRTDILDAARSAFVKEAIEGDRHPMLAALLAAFRGDARGKLAEGTRRPPLAVALEAELREAGLYPEHVERVVDVRLRREDDRGRSRLLHRLRLLGVRGFERVGGTDFVARDDLTDPSERWRLRWTPELEGDCIEASLYGSTVLEAVGAKLAERADAAGRDAEEAARLCLDAALAGLDDVLASLAPKLTTVLRAEPDFVRLSRALSHLLHLHRFDDALGTAGDPRYAALLVEAFDRAVWLLVGVTDGSAPVLAAVASLADARRRCRDLLPLAPLRDVARTVAHDDARAPSLRGAAAGVLYALGSSEDADIVELVAAFAKPEALGDFLTGLFTIAREALRAEPTLMQRLDTLLLAFSDDDFLAALPSMRLAFSFFPPRERHHLARGLLDAVGATPRALPALVVDPEAAADAMRLEQRVLATLARHGVRTPAAHADVEEVTT